MKSGKPLVFNAFKDKFKSKKKVQIATEPPISSFRRQTTEQLTSVASRALNVPVAHRVIRQGGFTWVGMMEEFLSLAD